MKEPTTEAGRNHVAHAHDHASMSPMCACPFGPDELAVETLAIEAGARAEQAPLIEEWLVRHDAEVIERVLARLENWPVYIADEAYHPQVSGEAMFCKADVMAQIRDLIPDTCGDPFCTDAREILADLSEAAKAHDAKPQADAVAEALSIENVKRALHGFDLWHDDATALRAALLAQPPEGNQTAERRNVNDIPTSEVPE